MFTYTITGNALPAGRLGDYAATVCTQIKAVSYDDQTLDETQKAKARENIGAVKQPSIVVADILLPTRTGQRRTIHYGITELDRPLPEIPEARFALCYTPYPPATDEHVEVAYSHDGVSWSCPTDMRRPIIPRNATPNNEGWVVTGDPDIFQFPDGSLGVYYAWSASSGQNYGQAIYFTKSEDGIAWDEPIQCFKAPSDTGSGALSPSAVVIGDTIHLYVYRRTNADGRQLIHRTASVSAPSTFSAPTVCTLPMLSGGKTHSWHHHEIVQRNGELNLFIQINGEQVYPVGDARAFQYLAHFRADPETPTVWVGDPAVPILNRFSRFFGNNYYRSTFLPALDHADSEGLWDGWIALWSNTSNAVMTLNIDSPSIAYGDLVEGVTSGFHGYVQSYTAGTKTLAMIPNRLATQDYFTPGEQVKINGVVATNGGTPVTVATVSQDANDSKFCYAKNLNLDLTDNLLVLPAPPPLVDARSLLPGKRGNRSVWIQDAGGGTAENGQQLDWEYKTRYVGQASATSRRIQNYNDLRLIAQANKAVGLLEIAGYAAAPVYGKYLFRHNAANTLSEITDTCITYGALTPFLRVNTAGAVDNTITPGMVIEACDASGNALGPQAVILSAARNGGTGNTDIKISQFSGGTTTRVFTTGNKVKIDGTLLTYLGTELTVTTLFCPVQDRISIVYSEYMEDALGVNPRGGYFEVFNGFAAPFIGFVSFRGVY